MLLGYNTNGLGCHHWRDALDLLAETGYRSVAITPDHHWLDPLAPGLPLRVRELQSELHNRGLACVIETGARFLLDPRRKHEPTLVSPEPAARQHRIDFLKLCIDVAADLGAMAVSFWSGVAHDLAPPSEMLERVYSGCAQTLEYALPRQIPLAFEPEPGMVIDSLHAYAPLQARLADPLFGLTIDIGHVHCNDDLTITAALRLWKTRLFNIHIEDMCRGIHEHLPFGEGEIDFPPVLMTLKEIRFQGGVHVELSRHSHAAPEMVRKSADFLRSHAPAGGFEPASSLRAIN